MSPDRETVNGKYYALEDRCGHMNALLSMGTLSNDKILTCPFHGAKFDVTNGKKVGEPVLTPLQEMEPLPPTWQTFFENVGQLMARIKTYDQKIMKSSRGQRRQHKNKTIGLFSRNYYSTYAKCSYFKDNEQTNNGDI